ncbi:hypothetical protein [Kitasatospora cineracea]|uniref:Uncharacterized protein n=1 Tax=Kitasatospora cineracea TaxID=88074 RepID=A0A3N4RNX8_9ACTN|nr:hypothetical protein [Kitasatospora cineracea]RPE32531.1 hypothetical protein EDD38_0795 [Kitasatospora cineracea]
MKDRYVHRLDDETHVVSDSPVPPMRVLGGGYRKGEGGVEEVFESVWSVAVASTVAMWLLRVGVFPGMPAVVCWGVSVLPAAAIAVRLALRFTNAWGRFLSWASAAVLLAAFAYWGLLQ